MNSLISTAAIHLLWWWICISFLHGDAFSPLPASATINKAGGNETDRLALLAIKDQITDDPMLVTSSWNDSLHFCQWKGVSCGRRHHQRVTALNLQSSGLVGSISPSIGNLSFLRTLNLSDNSFRGEIPHQLGLLFRLQVLLLRNNSLEGQIPSNLSHCSNLEVLSLHNNKLIGNVPAGLGSLVKLVKLDIGSNNLTGTIASFLGNLSSLEVFSAANNQLEGNIPDSLGHVKGLAYLYISFNNLYGMIPPSVYNLSSIIEFSVSGNQLHGNIPSNLGLASPNLIGFFIGMNQFSGTLPFAISNASNVRILNFAINEFSKGVPADFRKLQKLQWLNMFENGLGSGEANDLNFISFLINCSRLRTLTLDENNFGGTLPNSIANLSIELQLFGASGNEISGNIPTGIENLVKLNSLSLYYNKLSGSVPTSICKLHKLQEVGIGKNKLSGEIPSCIGNLTLLNKLWLEQNNLEGSIPSGFGDCKNLLFLGLYSNNLSGGIPRELMTLPSLSISLDLDDNHLSGSLPIEVGNLRNLVKLNLSRNELSGDIPSSLSSCETLGYLYMDHNFFGGAIPQSLRFLRAIEVLDLSSNNLSGEIPNSLGTLPFLRNLNLSFNDLEGEVPVEGVFKNITAISIYGNNKLCGGISALHLPVCPPNKPIKHGISLVLKLIIGLSCGLLAGVILASYFLMLCSMRKLRKHLSSTSQLISPLKTISYEELLKATDEFSSANLIGTGSFGSVYKGILDQNEATIAVKVLNLQNRRSSKTFVTECKALRNIRHRNLVKILTCCSSTDFQGNDFKALVFEFMPNGSLDTWLHPVPQTGDVHREPKSLNLLQRLNVAIDVASALDYLHNHCPTPIIHCDLKPSNILLDGDLTAHVSDFGLARLLKQQDNEISQSHTSSLGIKGTVGYAAPEYGVGSEVSMLGDVYSYGILLLEMFTGKIPTDGMFKDGLNLHKLAEMALPEHVLEIVDQVLLFGVEEEEATTTNSSRTQVKMEVIQKCLILIFKIGVACSMESPKDRMNISDAHKELQLTKGMLVESRTSN